MHDGIIFHLFVIYPACMLDLSHHRHESNVIHSYLRPSPSVISAATGFLAVVLDQRIVLSQSRRMEVRHLSFLEMTWPCLLHVLSQYSLRFRPSPALPDDDVRKNLRIMRQPSSLGLLS
jgi:hypothetical protein